MTRDGHRPRGRAWRKLGLLWASMGPVVALPSAFAVDPPAPVNLVQYEAGLSDQCDPSCEPAFQGGDCYNYCLDLWRGYCYERAHHHAVVSPRHAFDGRACSICSRSHGHPGSYGDGGQRDCDVSAAPLAPRDDDRPTIQPQPIVPQVLREDTAPSVKLPPVLPLDPGRADVVQPIAPPATRAPVEPQPSTPGVTTPVFAPPQLLPDVAVPEASVEPRAPQNNLPFEARPPVSPPPNFEDAPLPPLPPNQLPAEVEDESDLDLSSLMRFGMNSAKQAPPEPGPSPFREAAVRKNQGTTRLLRQLERTSR